MSGMNESYLLLKLALDEFVQLRPAVANGSPYFDGFEIITFRAIPNRKGTWRDPQVFSRALSVQQRFWRSSMGHVSSLVRGRIDHRQGQCAVYVQKLN